MGIYWRGRGKEKAAWGRKRIRGKEYRGPLGTKSKRDAQAAYQKWVADLEAELKGDKKEQRETTWREGVDNLITNHFPTIETSTQNRYLLSLEILTPHFENKMLQQIRKSDVAKFVTQRRSGGKLSKYVGDNPHLSDSTIIRDLQCMSAVFTVANDFDLCDINPANAYLKAMKNRGTLVNSEARKRYLRHAEEEALLQHALARAKNPKAIRRFEKFMIACAFALYIDTGMRAQELLNAKREWINLKRHEITIPGKWADRGEKGGTKSGLARTIPLFPRARRIIEMLPENKHTSLLLWRTASGKRFKDLNKTLQTMAAEIGITDIEIHDLRRTCGCRLLQDHRMKMAEVSAWLGHASVEITEAAYAFLETENLHDAIGGRVIDNAARLRLLELLGPTDCQAVLDGYLGLTGGHFRKQLLASQDMPTRLIGWKANGKKGRNQ